MNPHIFQFLVLSKRKPGLACSVIKKSNLTAPLRATSKVLSNGINENTKIHENTRKLVVYNAKIECLSGLKMIIFYPSVKMSDAI